MAADIGIMHKAVEDYISSMSKTEFDALVAAARDPEENTPAEETDLNKISARMFGEKQ